MRRSPGSSTSSKSESSKTLRPPRFLGSELGLLRSSSFYALLASDFSGTLNTERLISRTPPRQLGA